MQDIFFNEAETLRLKGFRDIAGEWSLAEADSLLHNPTHAIFIYGAGLFGMGTRDFLAKMPNVNGRLRGFLDSNPDKVGSTIDGLPIFDPRDDIVRNSNPLVIPACFYKEHEREMRRICQELGYAFLPHGFVFYSNDHEAICSGMDVWADDNSRRLYREMVRSIFADDNSALIPYGEEDIYFPSFIPAASYRSFVDAGAYIGDTLDIFRTRIGDAFDNYYAVEADPENFAKLELKTAGDPRVQCFQIALLDKDGAIPFYHRADSARSLTGLGEDTIPAAGLDSILGDSPVTFIKMDIEGAEKKALDGARHIITTQRPAMAVCLYHRLDDLWCIPLWIKRINPEYQLYLRYYVYGRYVDYACYAVPNPRI